MRTAYLTPFLEADGEHCGHRIVVQAPHGRPPFRLEVGTQWTSEGRFIAGRLGTNSTTFAHLRIDDWWEWVAVVSAGPAAPRVLPPIAARDRRPDWRRRFVEMLAESADSPLYAGEWWIGSAEEWSGPVRLEPSTLLTAQAARLVERSNGQVFALRSFGPSTGRRVGFWRKQIRAGHHPPTLLLYIAPLSMFAILDGHDRLHAAALEGVDPPLLVLSPLRVDEWSANPNLQIAQRAVRDNYVRAWVDASPSSQARLNAGLVRYHAHPRQMVSRLRAWPMTGGVDGMVQALERHRDALEEGPATARDVVDDMLFPLGRER